MDVHCHHVISPTVSTGLENGSASFEFALRTLVFGDVARLSMTRRARDWRSLVYAARGADPDRPREGPPDGEERASEPVANFGLRNRLQTSPKLRHVGSDTCHSFPRLVRP